MSTLQICELKIVLDESDTLHKHSRCSIELETTALGFLMLVEQHVRDYFELSGSLFRQELVILLRGFDVVAERNQRKGVRLSIVAFELNLLSLAPVRLITGLIFSIILMLSGRGSSKLITYWQGSSMPLVWKFARFSDNSYSWGC